MPLRLVIGRAGSGKTRRCLDAVRRELRAEPAEGPRLVLLVPEQAALQMERAMLGVEADAVAGFARCEVLSFRRLAHRVLNEVGPAQPRVLSDLGREMVLRLLLGRMREELRYFGPMADRPGVIERLAGTIVELFREQIAPESLAAAAGDEPASILSAKLHDIARLYGAYRQFLETGWTDPVCRLDVVRPLLKNVGWLTGCRLWVYGFAGFSGQEMAMLAELARLAAYVELTFLADPDTPHADGVERPVDPFGLFSRTERTLSRALAVVRAAGVEIDEPVRLESPPRDDDLGRLERGLFRSPRGERAAKTEEALTPALSQGEREQGRRDPCTTRLRRPAVRLIEAASPRAEVEAAARQIQRWVRDPEAPLKYRDIAIIARSLEPYHDLLTAALAEHGIPFFIDRRRPTAHHAMVELLRQSLAAAAMDWSLDATAMLLKTGLIGLDAAAADALENFLRAVGLSGWSNLAGGDWPSLKRLDLDAGPDEPTGGFERDLLDTINAARRRLVDAFGEWMAFAADGGARPVGDWVAALRQLLGQLDARATVAGWADAARAVGDLDLAEAHERVVADIDELERTLGEVEIDLHEFARVLEAGLSRLQLSLVPPSLDQVLVGEIERSRHPQIDAAIVIGLSDRLFPAAPATDVVLADDEREALVAAGVELGPTQRQRLLDERMLAYIAFTRPRRELLLSRPLADADGKPMVASPYLQSVRDVLGPLPVETVGQAGRSVKQVSTPTNLAGLVAMNLRQAAAGEPIAPGWMALYDWARQHEPHRQRLAGVLQGLVWTNEASLSASRALVLYGQRPRMSISQLESYAACPFQHFARYGLRLAEREAAELEAVDLGLFSHKVLERFVARLIASRRRLAETSDEELHEALDAAGDEVAASLSGQPTPAEARNRFLLDRAAAGLAEIAEAGRFHSSAGRFVPRAVELTFGLDEPGALPPLVLPTPGGRHVELRGRIDRLDIADHEGRPVAAVIDYKRTRSKRLDLGRVYEGLNLQLPGYLLVLREHGRKLVRGELGLAGALFLPLLGSLNRVEHPSEYDPEDRAKRFAPFKPRGLIDADTLRCFDATLEQGPSAVVSAFITKDGGLGRVDQTDPAPHDDFERLLAHVAATIGRLTDGVADGRIPVAPYEIGNEMPCAWCPYAGVCRFEFAFNRPRLLGEHKRSEVFERLRQEAESDGSDRSDKSDVSDGL